MEPHTKLVHDPAESKAVDSREFEAPVRRYVWREGEVEKADNGNQGNAKDKMVDMGAEEVLERVVSEVFDAVNIDRAAGEDKGE